ncbi:MAG: MBL fold metallo-hydrolase [Chloroflexi bacterium]|nr:MBL fold metallo-hydrolase [Chloroflexota bacterium]
MERGVASIVTDPYDASLGIGEPRLKADIITISHHESGHNAIDSVKGHQFVLDRPGEYEIGGVFLSGVATYNRDADPANTRLNLVFIIDFGGQTICHLGDLDYVPSQSQIEAFGPIDILMVPVGGGRALNSGQAGEVISLIEPSLVIPMHYQMPGMALELDPLDNFLKEMGVSAPDEQDVLRLSNRTKLPEETQVILLNRAE